MLKKIAFAYHGTHAAVGDLEVKRMLPNRYIQTVGPFFFLDYLLPNISEPRKAVAPTGDFAHPHRGIATFTYLFNGEISHYDSRGNRGTVSDGGAQWMKAGNGIIHDENPSARFQEAGGLMHGMQFWINLPAIHKAELPEYLAVQAQDFPTVELPNKAGILKVLIGTYNELTSPVKRFSGQFNYHLKLNPGAAFTLPINPQFESALFIPDTTIEVNGALHGHGELLVFDIEGNEINLINHGSLPANLIIFGGEGYTEPIVAEGPFVMNSASGIADAYRDYSNGKYGTIDYNS